MINAKSDANFLYVKEIKEITDNMFPVDVLALLKKGQAEPKRLVRWDIQQWINSAAPDELGMLNFPGCELIDEEQYAKQAEELDDYRAKDVYTYPLGLNAHKNAGNDLDCAAIQAILDTRHPSDVLAALQQTELA